MVTLNADTMRAIAPHYNAANIMHQAEIIAAVGAALEATLAAFEIDTALRAAHFLAQTCHESAGFRTTEEFASGDAYEGRANLGNTELGDGRRFKGRGLIQLTGRTNYKQYGPLVGLDLVDKPTTAAEPVISLKIACAFWQHRRLNYFADHDDILAITHRINGGFNGLKDRKDYLEKAKAAVGGVMGPAAAYGEVRQGDQNDDAYALQAHLKNAGATIGVDGDFGSGSNTVLRVFQTSKGLPVNGIAGPDTWAALA